MNYILILIWHIIAATTVKDYHKMQRQIFYKLMPSHDMYQ